MAAAAVQLAAGDRITGPLHPLIVTTMGSMREGAVEKARRFCGIMVQTSAV
jgi:hypothetical protein